MAAPVVGGLLTALVTGWAGRIVLSVVVQGFLFTAAVLYSDKIANFALNKIIVVLDNIGLLNALREALEPLGSGDLPNLFLDMMSCSGFTPAITALISGQISCIGLAVICRKLL